MARPATKTIVTWVLAVLVGLFFLSSAYPKLTQTQQMVKAFDNWGYSTGFLLLIGVLEALGGALLMIPRLATWGGAILVMVMGGAVYTHLTSGIGSPTFAIVSLIAAGLVAWLRKANALGLSG